MSDDVVIRAENLGKKYIIGHEAERERYVALRDVMARAVRNLASTATSLLAGGRRAGGETTEEFWALRNVDFEVRRGEVLGVIGRNGAGKSTLLKILSRITEPSEGRVTINGRVASLLEVGTGFHPELTGRENIYLNGAVLGMSRAEVRRQFDAIVDFAEVEKFLDTPVKRYSSGMYVRLAFAVAAHLQPDILIVDEVLAVGDAEFQKRCLGKMRQVAGGGRTVLFVSHNMSAVTMLCQRAMLLDRGLIQHVGSPTAVVGSYYSQAGTADSTTWAWSDGAAPGGSELRLVAVEVHGEKSSGPVFSPDEELNVAITYRQAVALIGARVVLQIATLNGEVAFTGADQAIRNSTHYQPGFYRSTCRIPGGLLNRTTYVVRLHIDIPGQMYFVEPTDIGQFVVEGQGNEGNVYTKSPWPGAVCPSLKWQIESVASPGGIRAETATAESREVKLAGR
jgi:lipopolysaccharide transport system ATP-binding protein